MSALVNVLLLENFQKNLENGKINFCLDLRRLSFQFPILKEEWRQHCVISDFSKEKTFHIVPFIKDFKHPSFTFTPKPIPASRQCVKPCRLIVCCLETKRSISLCLSHLLPIYKMTNLQSADKLVIRSEPKCKSHLPRPQCSRGATKCAPVQGAAEPQYTPGWWNERRVQTPSIHSVLSVCVLQRHILYSCWSQLL